MNLNTIGSWRFKDHEIAAITSRSALLAATRPCTAFTKRLRSASFQTVLQQLEVIDNTFRHLVDCEEPPLFWQCLAVIQKVSLYLIFTLSPISACS